MSAAIVSLIAAAALTASQPSPQPTPPAKSHLKIIYSVKIRPVCDVLHGIVIPFVMQEKQNNESFGAWSKKIQEMQTWGASGAEDAGLNGDDTPNGKVLLLAHQIDQASANMLQRLADIDTRLARSYHDQPNGKDPKLDELRTRLDNVVKLQRAVANSFMEQVDGPADAQGATGLWLPIGRAVPRLPIPNDNTLPAGTATPIPDALPFYAGGDRPVGRRFLAYAPRDHLIASLNDQEYGLVGPALDAVRTCDQ